MRFFTTPACRQAKNLEILRSAQDDKIVSVCRGYRTGSLEGISSTMLKAKLEELSAEIESFVSELSGEIEATKAEIDGFAEGVTSELQAISPEISSVQAELNSQFEALEGEIDEFTT